MDLSTFHTHRHHSWRPQWFSTFDSRPTGAAKRALEPATRKYARAFYGTGNTSIVFFLTARRHSKTGDFRKKRLRAVITTPTSDCRRQIPPTPLEASEYKLKLQGIDRRAPPGEQPRGFIWLNAGNLSRSDTEVTDRLIALDFVGGAA